ncbi:Aste57867_18102 [Aphanomyces stellatus]|uniref:Aste57867_18102 protein n=1 Tax=Aphanomyces stellatus TaxID=120398 RepID=A0A485L9J3_9STRA|nr:hypothetical protein As57867_018040 [Aphanomyces stellatus]VFT94840.1 Aste57867_18102 [Aphanomyces stellatus]
MAEDDPVVREIPVHLADILKGHIHVVQFPLRPVYRGMTNKPVHAKYKPVNSMLTLDYPVNMDEHYNKEDDQQMPARLQLQSSAVAPVSNYAVGVFRDGQLHLTPVSSILQMRPSMAHLDEEDDDMDVDEKQEKPKPSSSNVEEVQVQFQKRQSQRALAAMQNSYAYKRSVVQAESWVDLQINHDEEEEFEQLFSEIEDHVQFDITPAVYLKALSYRQDENAPQHDTNDTNVDESVLAVLQTYKVLHFKQLKEYLPLVSVEDLRSSVSRVAITIRGCLVPKSTLLKDYVEYRTAIVNELANSVHVSRSHVIEKYSIPPAIAKTLLAEYAELNPTNRLWRLKLPDDDASKWH